MAGRPSKDACDVASPSCWPSTRVRSWRTKCGYTSEYGRVADAAGPGVVGQMKRAGGIGENRRATGALSAVAAGEPRTVDGLIGASAEGAIAGCVTDSRSGAVPGVGAVEQVVGTVVDRPVSGRIFFEHVIRDNLDVGRPDQVSLIFDRRLKRTGPRATPGRFRTRVITEGVTPSLHVDYKTTTIKQYHKEGRALRTETTINNTRDFGIGKRLTNLPALREIGFPANRRLLRVQRLSHDPITGTQALHTITDPVTAPSGTRVAGLRLGQKRSHALLTALPMFRLQPDGFHNRDLRDFTAQLRGLTPTDVTGICQPVWGTDLHLLLSGGLLRLGLVDPG